MSAVDGPVSLALVQTAARDAVAHHAVGRHCCGDCPGRPECRQLRWAWDWWTRRDAERVWHEAARAVAVSRPVTPRSVRPRLDAGRVPRADGGLRTTAMLPGRSRPVSTVVVREES